jgi:hypothetical protein
MHHNEIQGIIGDRFFGFPLFGGEILEEPLNQERNVLFASRRGGTSRGITFSR